MTNDDKLVRIKEIDAKFENATGWGSWMATLSSERRCLVRELRAAGIVIDHRYHAYPVNAHTRKNLLDVEARHELPKV